MAAGHRDGFTARLDRWLADARSDDAAAARVRERSLREVAEQEATVAGVLLDLAERRVPVAVRTGSGRSHTGTLTALGCDFAALAGPGGEVLVAMGALRSVRTAPAVDVAVGDRTVHTDLRLGDVLALLAAERERALVVTSGGHEAAAGQLRSVGLDVIVLRPDGPSGATVYVPLAAVTEVVLA